MDFNFENGVVSVGEAVKVSVDFEDVNVAENGNFIVISDSNSDEEVELRFTNLGIIDKEQRVFSKLNGKEYNNDNVYVAGVFNGEYVVEVKEQNNKTDVTVYNSKIEKTDEEVINGRWSIYDFSQSTISVELVDDFDAGDIYIKEYQIVDGKLELEDEYVFEEDDYSGEDDEDDEDEFWDDIDGIYDEDEEDMSEYEIDSEEEYDGFDEEE